VETGIERFHPNPGWGRPSSSFWNGSPLKQLKLQACDAMPPMPGTGTWDWEPESRRRGEDGVSQVSGIVVSTLPMLNLFGDALRLEGCPSPYLAGSLYCSVRLWRRSCCRVAVASGPHFEGAASAIPMHWSWWRLELGTTRWWLTRLSSLCGLICNGA
jgi:hypothetical protein